ncbi:MAG: type II toxin-antitoxin system PemK/MazF family toxin [Bacteroidota bacterium]
MGVASEYIPDRGDIIWVNFDPKRGREQAGERPALVLSPVKYNQFGLLVGCPITSKIKGYNTEVLLREVSDIHGAVLTGQIHTFDWGFRGVEYITTIDEKTYKVVTQKIDILLNH